MLNALWKQAVTHLFLGPTMVKNYFFTVLNLYSLYNTASMIPVKSGAREECRVAC